MQRGTTWKGWHFSSAQMQSSAGNASQLSLTAYGTANCPCTDPCASSEQSLLTSAATVLASDPLGPTKTDLNAIAAQESTDAEHGSCDD